MKSIIKKILPCLIVIASIITISSCNKNTITYPSVYPQLEESFANQVFLKIGNLEVTNGDVFNRLKQSYGTDVLERIIDAKLLDFDLDEEQEADFNDQLNNIIYGTTDVASLTDEEKTELEATFESNMLSSGLYTDDAHLSSQLHYKNYYLLEYKRLVKTIEVIKQEIIDYDKAADETAEEDGTDPDYYFSDSSYVNFFTSYFHKTYDLIVVTFDSEKQAKDIMKKADIDISSLAGEWKSLSTGEVLTKDELVTAFINMYKAAYGKDIEGASTYTYEELYAIATSSTQDGTIATRAVKLNADVLSKSYSHGPLAFNGRWFVILKTGESDAYYDDDDNTVSFPDTEDYILEKDANNIVTSISDAVKEKIYDELVLSSFSSSSTTYTNTINRVMYELRQQAGLEIFDEGLEVTYKTDYESTFSALSITDYDSFAATENTSSTLIAKWDGGEVTVTDLYDYLTEQFGALLGLLFVQQYYVLTSEYNTVINYETGEILDNEKYEEYLESDYTTYKDAFDEGNFASSGYETTYGWANFLRDYVGITDEKEIVMDFEGSLYNDVVDLMRIAVYTAQVKDVTVSIKTSDEGALTWALSSDKWNSTYDTTITVFDETETPTLSVAYSTDDYDSDDELAANSYYGHFVIECKNADGETVRQVTPITIDQAVLEVYDDIYYETFSATASGVYAYFDKDLDGVADDVESDSADAALAIELVNKVWAAAEAKNNEKTIYTNISSVIREYQTAGVDSVWNKYKVAGLRLTAIESNTYSNSTSADEAILAAVKENWQNVVNYSSKTVDDITIGTTITGVSLDPGYRYVKNSVVYYVTAYDFCGNDVIYAENSFYRLAVIKATARTNYYYYRTSNGVETSIQMPSLYYYEQYKLDSSDRDVTINCSSQITTYYVPAINRLASDDVMSLQIMYGCKDILSKLSFTNNNDEYIAKLTKIIEDSIAEYLED